MPLLFELYVLIKLREAFPNQIDYHKRTYGNELDFSKKNENLIIDAKYIPDWEDHIIHENIRQLSGYARNVSIRKKVMNEYNKTEILPLLIIYPDMNGVENFSTYGTLINPETPLIRYSNDEDVYIKTYKIGVKLPRKEQKT